MMTQKELCIKPYGFLVVQINNWTRMHSSRMRTGRMLTVFWWSPPLENFRPPENFRHPPKISDTPQNFRPPLRKFQTPENFRHPPKISDTPLKIQTPQKIQTPPKISDPPENCRQPLPENLETPHVNRMTDRCKNITLAKTSFRPVKIHHSGWFQVVSGRHDFSNLKSVTSAPTNPVVSLYTRKSYSRIKLIILTNFMKEHNTKILLT